MRQSKADWVLSPHCWRQVRGLPPKVPPFRSDNKATFTPSSLALSASSVATRLPLGQRWSLAPNRKPLAWPPRRCKRSQPATGVQQRAHRALACDEIRRTHSPHTMPCGFSAGLALGYATLLLWICSVGFVRFEPRLQAEIGTPAEVSCRSGEHPVLHWTEAVQHQHEPERPAGIRGVGTRRWIWWAVKGSAYGTQKLPPASQRAKVLCTTTSACHHNRATQNSSRVWPPESRPPPA